MLSTACIFTCVFYTYYLSGLINSLWLSLALLSFKFCFSLFFLKLLFTLLGRYYGKMAVFTGEAYHFLLIIEFVGLFDYSY